MEELLYGKSRLILKCDIKIEFLIESVLLAEL